MTKIIILLGTHKGAFLLKRSARRDSWKLEGPFLKGYPVEYVVADQRQGTRLYVSLTNPFYGPLSFGQQGSRANLGIN